MNINNMAVALDNLIATVQRNADGTVSLRYVEGDRGLINVCNRYGFGELPYRFNLDNVTARESVHFPAGANVRHVAIFCSYATAPADANALATRAAAKGMVTFESTSDANADARLTRLDSPVDQSGGDDLKLNDWTHFQFSAALQNGDNAAGRVDVKSSDGATPFSFIIVGM